MNTGYNYYDKSIIKLTNIIKKGHVPLIQIYGTSVGLPFKNFNETNPDYIVFKDVSSNDEFFNIGPATVVAYNKAYTNVNIMFKFNQTSYSNYTITRQFSSFGQFSVYIYSSFGGSILELTKPINIQCIDSYTTLSKYFNHF